MILNDQIRRVLLGRVGSNLNSYMHEVFAPLLECIKNIPDVSSTADALALQLQTEKAFKSGFKKLENLDMLAFSDNEVYQTISCDVLRKTFDIAIQSLINISDAQRLALREEVPAAIKKLSPIVAKILIERNSIPVTNSSIDFSAVGRCMLIAFVQSDLFSTCEVDLPTALAVAWDTVKSELEQEIYDIICTNSEFCRWMKAFGALNSMQDTYSKARDISEVTKKMLPIWHFETNAQFDPESALFFRDGPPQLIAPRVFDFSRNIPIEFDHYRQENNLSEVFAIEFERLIASVFFHSNLGVTIDEHKSMLLAVHTLNLSAKANLCKLNALVNIIYSLSLENFARNFASKQFYNFVNANNFSDIVHEYEEEDIIKRCIDPFVIELKQRIVGVQLYACGNLCAYFKWPQQQDIEQAKTQRRRLVI